MLEKELQEIGLSDKEVKIYLASLELGQSVVQDIAKKADVNRATSYFVIEELIKRGFISSFHKGKKQYFVAADPERLIEFIEQEKNNLAKKEENLKKLLPQLKSINNKQKDKPIVKYYEGKEGVMAMLDEFLMSASGIINMAYSMDEINKVFTQDEKDKARSKRFKKEIKTRAIYTYKNGTLEQHSLGQRRKVPFDRFPIKSDIAVYDQKVRIASFGERLVGIIIEDKEIAESFKAILDLAWEAAEKYDKER